MRDDPPNPYRNLPLAEMHARMMERAGDLLGGRRVSRRDLAYLLIAASWRVSPHEVEPVKRADQVSAGETVESVFWPYYQREVASLRHHVVQQALDALKSSGRTSTAAIGNPTNSDEHLRLALALLGPGEPD